MRRTAARAPRAGPAPRGGARRRRLPGGGARREPASRPPTWTLEDLAGGSVSLAELRGRPVVIDFWATWCAPCEFQIPVLNQLDERYGDRVEVVGIAVDADGREAVAPFAAEHRIAYRVLLGDEDLAQRYGARRLSEPLRDPGGRRRSTLPTSGWWTPTTSRRPSRRPCARGPDAGGLKSRPRRVEGAVVPSDDLPTTARAEDTGYVVRQSYEREYAAGEVIYEVGDETQRPLRDPGRPGRAARATARAGRARSRATAPGDFFGEMGVLASRPRSVRAVAASDARLLELDRTTFEAHVRSSAPRSRCAMIRRLAARVTDLEQRLAALGADDLLRPVVRVLVRRAEPGRGARRPRGHEPSRSSPASRASRMLEAHRALGQLLERKRVRLQDDALVIPDLEALSAALD